MKKTVSQMRTEAREAFMKKIMEFFESNGDEALVYKGNAFCVPGVLENGDEVYYQVVISLPTGTRDGNQFNGHEEHADYMAKLEEKKIEAEAKAAEKAKIAAERKAKQEAARKKREAEEAAKKAKREGGGE